MLHKIYKKKKQFKSFETRSYELNLLCIYSDIFKIITNAFYYF